MKLPRTLGAVLAAAVLFIALVSAVGGVAAAAGRPPVITSISPGYGPLAGGTVVTITGTGFIGATSVSFGTKAAASFSVASDTQITATTPAGTGIVPVTVTTRDGTASRKFSYTPIQHVVVIYLENQSFDSVLGYWCDANPRRCPAGGMPASVTLSDGSVVKPGIAPDTVPNVLHSVAAQTTAMDGGKMDGWANIPDGTCDAATGYACITGYQPSAIPNFATLATDFAISDRTFSLADSPSFGGHLYAVMPSTDGFTGDIPFPDKAAGAPPFGPGWGCDSNRITTVIGVTGYYPSCIPDPSLPLPNGGAFEPTPVHYVKTIMDRLDGARLPWKIYGTPYPTNWQYPEKTGYTWSTCPVMAECLYTSQDKNLVDAGQFVTDAAAGNLGAWSLVVPGTGGGGASCHNNTSMALCDNWAGQLVSAAENGPDWSSTAIFITFDDCGCFYDQVPPGTNPDGTQRGPRSPLFIVSPYAKAGYTDDHSATFASILAFTERNFGLEALGVNDAKIYDYSNAFNYTQAPLSKTLAVMRQYKLPASALLLKPSAAQFGDT